MLPLATVGCAHHYYHYGPQDDVYYHQWVTETHHDPHVDYQHLSRKDQKDYENWRRSHDHDHQ